MTPSIPSSSRRPADAPTPARVRELAVAALEAYVRGLAAMPPTPPDVDASFITACLERLTSRLSPSDLACLKASARSREDGLHLCRSGRADEAEALLAQARATLTETPLSEEARVVAESFQRPAEAYLHYRRGRPRPARRALLDGLGCCRVMEATYAYAMEARRVHLANNVVRVERRYGDRTEALHLALRLVSYVDGAPASWPFDDVAVQDPAPLSEEERRVLMDQTSEEISHLLLAVGPDADNRWRDPMLTESVPSNLRAWLEAMDAVRRDDTVAFLENARVFFETGPALPNAWREVRSALRLVSERALAAPPR